MKHKVFLLFLCFYKQTNKTKHSIKQINTDEPRFCVLSRENEKLYTKMKLHKNGYSILCNKTSQKRDQCIKYYEKVYLIKFLVYIVVYVKIYILNFCKRLKFQNGLNHFTDLVQISLYYLHILV